jgi:hypothetical protein
MDLNREGHSYLGRSKNGVYFASFMESMIRVWILDELGGQMNWIRKGEYDLRRVPAFDWHVHGPWVLQDINYEFFHSQLPEVNEEAISKEKFEWNSDNDGVDNGGDAVRERRHGFMDILGFHPYKEIMFFSSFEQQEWRATVHAFHLNSSKVECLGNMAPTCYEKFEPSYIQSRYFQYFPYTPCCMDELPCNK